MADDKTLLKEELIREMERRSNDSIKVYNPESEDFKIKWDGYVWVIPNKDKDEGYGKGMTVLPRYLAQHYVHNMTDHLIMKESDVIVAAAKRKYNGSDWPREEERVALRTNNPKLVEYWAKQLWVGKVKDFGIDRTKVEEEPQRNPDKPLHIDILDRIEKEKGYVEEKPKPEPSSDVISQISE